jgi:1-acyl-sn-glycerol-3-phosphate acyltransferase
LNKRGIFRQEEAKSQTENGCSGKTGLERKGWVFWITRTAGRILLSPFFVFCVEGVGNLPRESAFVLLPKHQRWEDIPLLSLATPRPLYYVAKHELFENPLARWYLTALGGLSLNRQRPLESRRSMKAVIRFLKEGEGVVIFPEGTYYRDRMGPGHAGIIRLVLSRLALPFVPVGIRYRKSGLRTRVMVRFGRPFQTDENTRYDLLLEQMMDEIAELSGFATGCRNGKAGDKPTPTPR